MRHEETHRGVPDGRILGGAVPELVARQRHCPEAKTEAGPAVIRLARDRILEVLSRPERASLGESALKIFDGRQVVLGTVDSQNRIGVMLHGCYATLVRARRW
jgi:hypothetical protein